MKKPIVLRILAAVAGVILVVGLFAALFSFTGDPISYFIARNEINEHLNRNYSYMTAKQGKIQYQRTGKTYYCEVQDQNSPDIKFQITYDHGIVTDDYNLYVETGYSTINRMGKEYGASLQSKFAQRILQKYENSFLLQQVDVYNHQLNMDAMKFPINAPLDTKLFKQGTVEFRLKGDATPTQAAEILQYLYQQLEKEGYEFQYFSVCFEPSGLKVKQGCISAIWNARKKDIESPQFIEKTEELAQQALQNETGCQQEVYFENTSGK